MKTRAITGFFFIAILIGAVLLGAPIFVAFFTLVGTACVYEFYKMVQTSETKPLGLEGTVLGAALLTLAGLYCLGWLDSKFLLCGIIPVFILYISALFRHTLHPMQDVAYTLLGLVYVILPFAFFVALGFLQLEYNAYIPLGFLILLWTNDTGAYLAGKSFGKRKLFERISPKKTWEGFFGGVLLAVVVAINLSRYFGSLSQVEWVIVALIIGVFGTLGDLVESMFKRNLGVKDSGKILPGHGGLLDRFDGLLMAAPLIYLFLKFIG